MKNIFILSLVMLAGISAQARNLYTGSCALSVSSGYYEPCEPGHATADRAAKCAQNEAQNQCVYEANRFCKDLTFSYKYGMSKEIPGYQYCSVKAVVEGFK